MPPIPVDGSVQFPRGFLWGAATAAHQVEGGNSGSDWWAWERIPGHIRDSSTADAACDQYHRFREDFDLLAALHQNAHRLSIEWARIEPRPGEYNRQAIVHYRQVLEALRERGVEPLVTLHHFTNPLWLAQQGGWANPAVVEVFGRFARVAAGEFGDLVTRWVTINEPLVYAHCGYLDGVFPPGRRSARLATRVVRNMLLAHAHAYRVIHAARPGAATQVGIAHHLRVFDPHRPGLPLDHWLAALVEYLFNRVFLAALTDGRLRFPLGHGQVVPGVAGAADFLGLNYYTRDRVGFHPGRPGSLFSGVFPVQGERSQAGWEIYPEGLYRLLKFLQPLGKPIYITENGVADEDDELRPRFLLSHLLAAHRAIGEGVPLRGYFHWSALDNFEWADGYGLRFGLIHVDYQTQQRTVKPSGWLYSEICERGAITRDQLQRHAPDLLAAGPDGTRTAKGGG